MLSSAAISRFDGLYADHERAVRLHLRRFSGEPAVLEDLASQTFLQALTAFGRYEERGQARAWLVRIAHRVGIDHLRAASEGELAEDVAEETDGPEVRVLRSFELETVRWAVAGLSDERRRVVELRFFDGRSVPDTAAVLGKSEGAVRVIQCRALKALRAVLA